MHALPRIAIVHVAKTGGTWLRELLQPFYAPGEICPHQFEHQFSQNINALNNYKLFDGHFGYEIASQLDANLITIIRNPFDRIISLYHYWKEIPASEGGPRLAKKVSFEEFLVSDDPERIIEMEVVNTQAWQIAFGTTLEFRDKYSKISPDELLSKAVRNLQDFAIVGTTDNMGFVAEEVGNKFGLNVNASLSPLNTTRSRPKLNDIPMYIRDIIYQLVNVDLALYDHVLHKQVTRKYNRLYYPQIAGTVRSILSSGR